MRENKQVAPIAVISIAVDTQELQPVKRKSDSKNIVTLGTFIGKNPPFDFVEHAISHAEMIRLTGYVPELPPHLEQSALMVVSVRARGGMQVRMLEAFA